MNNTDRIGVVVPTYERPAQLRDTVDSLRSQTIRDYEVVIVDDGSESVEQRAVLDDISEFDRFSVIRQENAGPATARNRGWQRLDTEFVAFTDDDCVVPEHWLNELLSGYEDDRVAGVGGPLVPADDTVADNVFAQFDRYKNEIIYDLPVTRQRGGKDVHVGGTANMSYRRSVLEELDGFDESFPRAAGEDADLKRRVVEAGYELVFTPVPVVHHKQFTGSAFVSQSIRRGRGEFHFHRKWNDSRSVSRIIAGFIASPLQLIEHGSLEYPVPSILYVIHQALSRIGELSEAFDIN